MSIFASPDHRRNRVVSCSSDSKSSRGVTTRHVASVALGVNVRITNDNSRGKPSKRLHVPHAARQCITSPVLNRCAAWLDIDTAPPRCEAQVGAYAEPFSCFDCDFWDSLQCTVNSPALCYTWHCFFLRLNLDIVEGRYFLNFIFASLGSLGSLGSQEEGFVTRYCVAQNISQHCAAWPLCSASTLHIKHAFLSAGTIYKSLRLQWLFFWLGKNR